MFNNKAANKGFTPEDLNSHGTHVAGTVACNEHTDAVVDGVVVSYDPSGVAPRALLGNDNVFPGDDADARSEDIVDALEEAYEDGFRIANMSLGGGSSGNNDLLAMATDNLDLANMVVAVAAGNSGPGFSTIESPGKAARALTAGASTVGHFHRGTRPVGWAQRPGDRRRLPDGHSGPDAAAGRRRGHRHAERPEHGLQREQAGCRQPHRQDRADLTRDMHVLGEDPERAGRGS